MTSSPPQVDLSGLTANAIVMAAKKHREAKRLAEAVALLETAIELWPRNARVRHQLGLALVAKKDGYGVEHLLTAARQEPTNVDYLADLAEGVEAVGRRDIALGWFRRSLAQAPGRADLALRLGRMLDRFQLDREAENWIRRAIALDPGSSAAHRSLGALRFRLGQQESGLETYRRAVEAAPGDGEAHGKLAVALRESGASEVTVMDALKVAADLQPERMQVVLPFVSYLRAIGDEEGYIAYSSRHLAIQMKAAADDEIGKHGIRILWPDTLTERIGEIATQLELHVKMKLLGWLPPFVTILLAPKEKVVNHVFLDHWRRYVTVVDDPTLIDLMEPLKERIPFNPIDVMLPDGRAFSKGRAYHAVQGEWLRQGRGPLLELSHPEVEHGRAELRRMGVPEGAWFVCLHVRDPGYMKEQTNSPEAARNASIGTYLSAVEEVTRRGGWVIRLGEPTVPPLPPMAQVIDYAVSPFKSEAMDVFLMASCRFLLGTTSGPVVIAEAFGVPVGAADYFPIGGLLHMPNDVIIPKPHREKATGRMLQFEEYLRMPFAFAYDSNEIARYGLEALPSEPEDILDLAIEMLERTEGKWPYDAEDEKLNARWHEISKPFTLGYVGCRIGRGFLRRHRHLFRSI